jgi:hypothetical protein
MRTVTKRSSSLLAFVLLPTLIVSLSWLHSAYEFSKKSVTRVESGLRNPGKLKGVARKAASAEWFMQQRTYPLAYIPQDAEIRAVDYVRNRMIPELLAHHGLQTSAAALMRLGESACLSVAVSPYFCARLQK